MELTYENSIKRLLEAVPEFYYSKDYKSLKSSQDLSYIVYGVLGNYIKDLYAKNINSPILARLADFLELLAASDDGALKDLFLAGFIENIAYESCVEKLGPKAQQAAKELREFDAKPPLPWSPYPKF